MNILLVKKEPDPKSVCVKACWTQWRLQVLSPWNSIKRSFTWWIIWTLRLSQNFWNFSFKNINPCAKRLLRKSLTFLKGLRNLPTHKISISKNLPKSTGICANPPNLSFPQTNKKSNSNSLPKSSQLSPAPSSTNSSNPYSSLVTAKRKIRKRKQRIKSNNEKRRKKWTQ